MNQRDQEIQNFYKVPGLHDDSFANPMNMMPSSDSYEEAVLGCLVDGTQHGLCRKLLGLLTDPEVFWKDKYKHLFEVIRDMHRQRAEVNLMTVVQKLREVPPKNPAAALGPSDLAHMTTRAAISEHTTESYALKLLELHTRRKTIWMGQQLIQQANDMTRDVFEMSSFASKTGQNIVKGLSIGNDEHINSVLTRFLHRKDEQAANRERPMYTGIRELDAFMGGIMYPSTELIVLGARPSMGKSMVAGQIVQNLAMMGTPVGYISLEMDNEELVQRMAVKNLAGIASNQQLIRGMEITPDILRSLNKAAGPLFDKPLWMLDKSRLTISELVATIERWVTQYGVQLVILDFLQRVRVPGIVNRQQEVGFVSSELKAIARDFKTPIIALSSLNRNAERTGGSGKPSMADLRESGDVESDADIVLMQWLPERYGHEELDDPNTRQKIPTKNMMKWEFEKFRNGRTGSTYAYVDMSISAFYSDPNRPPSASEPEKPQDSNQFSHRVFNHSGDPARNFYERPDDWG